MRRVQSPPAHFTYMLVTPGPPPRPHAKWLRSSPLGARRRGGGVRRWRAQGVVGGGSEWGATVLGAVVHGESSTALRRTDRHGATATRSISSLLAAPV